MPPTPSFLNVCATTVVLADVRPDLTNPLGYSEVQDRFDGALESNEILIPFGKCICLSAVGPQSLDGPLLLKLSDEPVGLQLRESHTSKLVLREPIGSNCFACEGISLRKA
jgi:hypothetical protein